MEPAWFCRRGQAFSFRKDPRFQALIDKYGAKH
jgi:hypothetical protein